MYLIGTPSFFSLSQDDENDNSSSLPQKNLTFLKNSTRLINKTLVERCNKNKEKKNKGDGNYVVPVSLSNSDGKEFITQTPRKRRGVNICQIYIGESCVPITLVSNSLVRTGFKKKRRLFDLPSDDNETINALDISFISEGEKFVEKDVYSDFKTTLRTPTQYKLFNNMSAREYYHSVKEHIKTDFDLPDVTDIEFQYCHLIGSCLSGPQTRANLIVGTKPFNIHIMKPFEIALRNIIKNFDKEDKIKLSVKAHLLSTKDDQYVEIAQKIDFQLEYLGKKVTLVFDPLTHYRPTRDLKAVMRKLLEGLLLNQDELLEKGGSELELEEFESNSKEPSSSEDLPKKENRSFNKLNKRKKKKKPGGCGKDSSNILGDITNNKKRKVKRRVCI